ncbi:hypothetical protein KIN20_029071, partial [Parelaphostrongylus tenuis]
MAVWSILLTSVCSVGIRRRKSFQVNALYGYQPRSVHSDEICTFLTPEYHFEI